MRKTIQEAPHLVLGLVEHPHADELRAMSDRLDQTPQALDLIYADIVREGGDPNKGRNGMTAEQVLRCTIAKQMNGWSYAELAFHLNDSLSYRAFCRFGLGEDVPKKSTLKSNLKRVRADSWEAINRLLLEQAETEGIEKGKKVRTDCTVEESNIHAPSDSSLLWDGVRVLARDMVCASEFVSVKFTNHQKRAKRRAIAIHDAPTNAKRRPLYRDLLKVTHKTVSYALQVVEALGDYQCGDLMEMLRVDAVASELRHYVGLTQRVIDQTQRRVFGGESVPASEKIVSIFEPHTDVIVKDRRETYYGHKLCLTSGASGLVLDCVVQEGNPQDSTLAVKMIERQQQLYGRLPRQVSFDGGFSSKPNVTKLKEMGVEDVCFTKCRYLKDTEMVKSTWVYRKLRRFRAGVEAGISFLKRCFGLDRCTWKGHESFKAYTWASIVSHNLLLLARHSLP